MSFKSSVTVSATPIFFGEVSENSSAFRALFKTLTAVLIIAFGAWAEDNVPYIDTDGTTKYANGVTVIDADNIATIGNLDGWYLVRGTITRNSTLTVSDEAYRGGEANIILEDGSDLTVTGSLNDAGINDSTGHSLTIYAQSIGSDMGKLTATGGRGNYGGAGIGGGIGGSGSGTITINGGMVTATGGNGAGIGGGYRGYDGASTITINGGIVTATSGSSGAGIGGGYGSNGGKIIISGGTVTATSDSIGAGIGGGGYGGNGGKITISGGIVTATGIGDLWGESGAGIGGGSGGSGGEITISGGTVTATGGESGAGIGGGQRGNGGEITISGGKVTATGGYNGAGIGGGYKGDGGEITISGGMVTAIGGGTVNTFSMASIGSGYFGSTITKNSGVVAMLGNGGGEGIGGGSDASSNGTFTLDGNAVVFASSVGATNESLALANGILFIDDIGISYGSVTISEDLTIPTTYTLTIPENSELIIASGITLTNNGELTNNGTVTLADGSIITINGTASGSKIIGASISPTSVSSKTLTSITLGGVADLLAATGQEIEYAISTTDAEPASGWQTGLVFSGLTPNTTYYIFARSKENEHFNAGTASKISAEIACCTEADLNFAIPTDHIYNGEARGIGNATTKTAGFGQVTILYNESTTLPTNAGTYPITAKITEEATEVTIPLGSYVITKKSVTITADAKTKVYGSPDPELTYSAEPELVSGDNFSGSLSRETGDNVGNYAITQGILTAGDNYELTFVDANFAITPSPCEEGYERNESGECVLVETQSSSSTVTQSSSSEEGTLSSSSEEGTPSSSSEQGALSSSSADTPSSSSSEGTPIRLPQIATVNQATQIYNGVNLQATNGAVVEIYSLKGDLINKQKFGSGVYNVSLRHLPKGMYIVKATFGSEKQILRVPVR